MQIDAELDKKKKKKKAKKHAKSKEQEEAEKEVAELDKEEAAIKARKKQLLQKMKKRHQALSHKDTAKETREKAMKKFLAEKKSHKKQHYYDDPYGQPYDAGLGAHHYPRRVHHRVHHHVHGGGEYHPSIMNNSGVRIQPSGEEHRAIRSPAEATGNLMKGPKTDSFAFHISQSEGSTMANSHDGEHIPGADYSRNVGVSDGLEEKTWTPDSFQVQVADSDQKKSAVK